MSSVFTPLDQMIWGIPVLTSVCKLKLCYFVQDTAFILSMCILKVKHFWLTSELTTSDHDLVTLGELVLFPYMFKLASTAVVVVTDLAFLKVWKLKELTNAVLPVSFKSS